MGDARHFVTFGIKHNHTRTHYNKCRSTNTDIDGGRVRFAIVRSAE